MFSRSDGDLVRKLSLTRRIMPYLMPTRSESIVFFEQKADVTETLPFLDSFRQATGLRATLTHLVIWAVVQTLKERPRLNRFVAGGKLYQRREISVSASLKKAKDDRHPVVVVKRVIDPHWTFEEIVRKLEESFQEGRSERLSGTDRELQFFLKLPSPLLSLAVKLQKLLDAYNLLPSFFYRSDPLYASVFIANLGSLGMDAAYHHLFEYGNIPIFILAGRVKKEPLVQDDQLVVRPLLTLRYSFDERIEDGLYCFKALERLRKRLEHPNQFL